MKNWNGITLAKEINSHLEKSVLDSNDNDVYVDPEKIYQVMKFLKETSGSVSYTHLTLPTTPYV